MHRWPPIQEQGNGDRTARATDYLNLNPIKIIEKTTTHMDIETFSEETLNDVTISRGDYERKWHRLVFGKKIKTKEERFNMYNQVRISRSRYQSTLGTLMLIPKDRRSRNKKQCVIMPNHIDKASTETYPDVVGCSCLDYLFRGPNLEQIVKDPFTGRQYYRGNAGEAYAGCKHILAYNIARDRLAQGIPERSLFEIKRI